MELRVLRYFLAVAREQSITRASEILHITQPTLSKQLMNLEDELGKRLLIRGKRKVTLTEEGMFLQKRAQEIIELSDKTQAAFHTEKGAIAGDVYIGCGETESMRLLIKAMKQLHQAHPDIHFHLYSGNDREVAERLEQGLVDFGVFVGNTDLSKYDYQKLPKTDRWGLLLHKDHPLAAKQSVTPADMAGLTLFCSRQMLEQNELSGWLGYSFHSLNITDTYNLIRNAAIMVEEGLGCTVTLEHLVNTEGTCLVFLPLEPMVKAEITIAWKKYQIFSKAAEAFLDCLREEIARAS